MSDTDEKFMKLALEAARRAANAGEVPVGACIVDPVGNLIATAQNRTITDVDPTAHAEILALRTAALKTENYRLTDCVLYTTIEPCVMCAGALVNARIGRLVYGAADMRYGAAGTIFDLCDNEILNHRMNVTAGVLESECGDLMREFFRNRRNKS